jgi:cell division protein FtsB
MRILLYVATVALGIGAGFSLITERAALTRAGYRIATVERERQELIEQNRQLEARIARLKTGAHIAERAMALGLDLVPPEDTFKEKRPEPPKRR